MIQDGSHLSQCLFYIEMNMVRAGVVEHPRKWRWSSYHELLGEQQRYRLLDMELFLKKLACTDIPQFREWFSSTLNRMSERRAELVREPWWSESRIVGDRQIVVRHVDNCRAKDIIKIDEATCALP
ncbi:MAG: hypothetical protein QXH80_04315 [Candidatus Nanoarchaeia archaeon]